MANNWYVSVWKSAKLPFWYISEPKSMQSSPTSFQRKRGPLFFWFFLVGACACVLKRSCVNCHKEKFVLLQSKVNKSKAFAGQSTRACQSHVLTPRDSKPYNYLVLLSQILGRKHSTISKLLNFQLYEFQCGAEIPLTTVKGTTDDTPYVYKIFTRNQYGLKSAFF